MLDWVAGVLTSTKTATDITKVLVDMKTDAAVQAKAVELTSVLMQLQQQLMAAQMEQMNLIKRIEGLEAELKSAKKQDDLSERYMLHRFETGHHAYVLRPEFKGSEPDHYLCSRCFENGKRITLQGQRSLKCPECDSITRAQRQEPIMIRRG